MKGDSIASGQNRRVLLRSRTQRKDTGPVRLQITSPDSFHVQQQQTVRLVFPTSTKQTFFDWPVKEKYLRSVVLSEQGHVVSSGLPKFFAFKEEENLADYALQQPAFAAAGRVWNSAQIKQSLKANNSSRALRRALRNNEPVYFTEKLGGTMIIRSVVDGNVIFRTQNSFDCGDHSAEVAQASQPYSSLHDPTFDTSSSLVFQLVDEDLILIGQMQHHSLCLTDIPQLADFADQHQLNMVKILSLPTDINQLVETVDGMGSRSVVARFGEGQQLVTLPNRNLL